MDHIAELDKFQELELEIFRGAIACGEYGPSEKDIYLNAITQEKCFHYAKNLGGKCWLGRVNRYDKESEKILWLHDIEEHHLYNFGATFAIPAYDDSLFKLIESRENRPWTSTKNDYPLVKEIFKKVHELGGIMLNWV